MKKKLEIEKKIYAIYKIQEKNWMLSSHLCLEGQIFSFFRLILQINVKKKKIKILPLVAGCCIAFKLQKLAQAIETSTFKTLM